MKLYKSALEYCPELREHPELVAQRPGIIGITDSGVYRFKGTNIYSWYAKKFAGYWDFFGELILLKPSDVKKFKEQRG